MTRRASLHVAVNLVFMTAMALSAHQTPVRDAAAPPRPVGTGRIAGTVLDDVTGKPLRRASVSLSNAEFGISLTAVTDETGTFTFADLPDGRYNLGAGKPTYIGMSYGATKPQRPGTGIVVSSSQPVTGVTLRLAPGAVITGTVRNRLGEPVPDARLQVMRFAPDYQTGLRTLVGVRTEGTPFGQPTDDRGTYRLFGLPADDYYVLVTIGIGGRLGEDVIREITTADVDWATRALQSPAPLAPAPAPGPAVDYAPIFYPGVSTQTAATMITVKAGEERSGIDIVLDRTPMGKITGTIVSPDGPVPSTLLVNIVANDAIPGIPFSGFGNARVDASGQFRSGGLSPGDYTITVRVGAPPSGRAAGPAPGSPLFGLTTVSVNGGDVETTVTLARGVTVSGRLVFEGTTVKPPADLTKIRVTLTAARGRTPSLGVPAAAVDAAGMFTFTGVTPGRYTLTASGAGGWFVRSATLSGAESLDVPVEIGQTDVSGAEIKFSDVTTEVSGDLLDAANRPAPGFFIILFPADRQFWVPQSRRIQSVRPGSDGKFKASNLPPGEYYIAAVTDVEQSEWFDPNFLAQLVGAATKITLAEAEKKVQSLRIR